MAMDREEKVWTSEGGLMTLLWIMEGSLLLLDK
jgi:hypothetical protein